MTDHVHNQLCARIEELEKEKLELNEQVDALQVERDALAAHVERLREGLHQALIHWGAHCTDEDGTAYAECEKRCDEASTTSLTHLKAQWQSEAFQELYNTWKGGGMMRVGALLDKAIELQEEAEEGEA